MQDWEKNYWDELLSDLPVSPQSECSYFPERQSCMRYFFSDETIPASLIDVALGSGFRRCGDMWYRTNCHSCQACQPYRIPVDRFSPSRNMKRVQRLNRDLTISFVTPELTDEKRELYLRYQHSQHYLKPAFTPLEEKPFDSNEAMEIMEYQMYCNPATSLELNIHLNDTLIGFGNLDVGETSVSLVYFVFDHEHDKRSLGTVNILASLLWAREQNFSYLYLGYYIADHPKMAYKSRFRPAEIRSNDEWSAFLNT